MIQMKSGLEKSQKISCVIGKWCHCCHLGHTSRDSLYDFTNCHLVKENIKVTLQLTERPADGAVVEKGTSVRTFRVALSDHGLGFLEDANDGSDFQLFRLLGKRIATLHPLQRSHNVGARKFLKDLREQLVGQ